MISSSSTITTPTFAAQSNRNKNVCFRLLQVLYTRIRNKVPPFLTVFLVIESLWMYYDSIVTINEKHRPKRQPIIVTETSPISPYYSTGYNGYSRIWSINEKDGDELFFCHTLMNQHQMYSRSGIDDGLVFINEMEIGSTIYASITARIAERYGRRKQQKQQAARNAYRFSKQHCNTTLL